MRYFIFVLFLGLFFSSFSQIPIGSSSDTVKNFPFYSNGSSANDPKQIVYYYKPSSYDPNTSPLVFVNHGVGGTGISAVNSFADIADRRGALLVGLQLTAAPGTTMNHQVAETNIIKDTNIGCSVRRPGTDILKWVYRHILERENRTEIPCYMIGFSAGGQFANRYNTYRQAYPDSIPFKMIVSSNGYYYTFPTDSLNGVEMPKYCGLSLDQAPLFSWCPEYNYFYNYNCSEHIAQIYASNYGILIGTGDTAPLSDNECAMAQGSNRYERAYNLYHFGLTDSQNQGLQFNWQYAEVPGIGHDDYATYHALESPGDTYTIAEKLLFDSPYVEPQITSPIASFKIGDLWGSNVSFINTSSNSVSYYWDFGDGHVSTTENPIHHYTVPGTFTVQLTAYNAGGCQNWTFLQNVVEITTADIQSIENGVFDLEVNDNLLVFPNPNDGQFQVSNPNLLSLKYVLFNSFGQKIKECQSSEKEQLFNVELESGIYFLLIQNESQQVVKKIIIK